MNILERIVDNDRVFNAGVTLVILVWLALVVLGLWGIVELIQWMEEQP